MRKTRRAASSLAVSRLSPPRAQHDKADAGRLLQIVSRKHRPAAMTKRTVVVATKRQTSSAKPNPLASQASNAVGNTADFGGKMLDRLEIVGCGGRSHA